MAQHPAIKNVSFTPTPLKSVTVAELIIALQDMPADAPVLCWAPGQYWLLGKPFLNKGRVLLEGNAE